MSSIFDLDNKKRSISSGDVRRVCGMPDSATWARYRAILGIKNDSLTILEAFLLWAGIQAYYHRPGASKAAIYAAAAALLNARPDQGVAIARLCGSEGVRGDFLGEAIGLATGIYPDESTLYRWASKHGLGKHSRGRLYPSRTVNRLCKIALKSRAKLGSSGGSIA